MLGFSPSEEPITDNMIAGAEALFGITYPQSYRDLVWEFGGADGEAVFPLEQLSPGFEYCSIGLIHSLNPCSPYSIYSLMAHWSEHDLDATIIPFGEDGGGNYICFDYRNVAENPAIVFYFHELSGDDGIMKVCESFDEFLDRLCLPDDHGETT